MDADKSQVGSVFKQLRREKRKLWAPSALLELFVWSSPLFFFALMVAWTWPLAPSAGLQAERADYMKSVSLASLPELSRVRARDGFDLGVREYPGSTARFVILMHGLAADSRHMHALAEQFGADATVVVPDVRGHGASIDLAEGHVAHSDQLLDDLEDLVAALRRRAPSAQLLLAGFSGAGGFALNLLDDSVRQPLRDSFAGIALITPYFGPATEFAVSERMLSAQYTRGALLWLGEQLHVPQWRDSIVLRIDIDAERGPYLYSYNGARAFVPLALKGVSAVAADVQRRVVVIGGERDKVHSNWKQGLEPLLPQAKFVTVAGAGHFNVLKSPEVKKAILALAK